MVLAAVFQQLAQLAKVLVGPDCITNPDDVLLVVDVDTVDTTDNLNCVLLPDSTQRIEDILSLSLDRVPIAFWISVLQPIQVRDNELGARPQLIEGVFLIFPYAVRPFVECAP